LKAQGVSLKYPILGGACSESMETRKMQRELVPRSRTLFECVWLCENFHGRSSWRDLKQLRSGIARWWTTDVGMTVRYGCDRACQGVIAQHIAGLAKIPLSSSHNFRRRKAIPRGDHPKTHNHSICSCIQPIPCPLPNPRFAAPKPTNA